MGNKRSLSRVDWPLIAVWVGMALFTGGFYWGVYWGIVALCSR